MANPNTRLVLDLARDTQEYIDMTPYFQGRVGDSQSFVPIALLRYGKPFDMTGYDLVAMGQDPAGVAKRAWQTSDANGPGDSWRAGKLTLRFPAGFFTTPGEWESFCFKVVDAGTTDPDNAQTIISTLNLKLRVFDDAVYMQTAIEAYDTYADSLVESFGKYIKIKMEEINNLPQSLQATIDASKTLSDVVDQYLDLFDKKGIPTMATLNAMISAAATDATTKVNNAIAGLTKSASDFNVATTSATDYIMSPNSSNGPNNLAGVVSVHGNSTQLYQLFVDSSNDAWTRVRNGSSWTAWNHVTMFY